MKRILTRRHAFGLAILAIAAASLSAQEARPVLTVQTANGQAAFHIGERIPLKLTFTSPNDTQFLIAPWRVPRGGEFDFERVNVSPSSGWADPLATYFAQGFIRTVNFRIWPPFLKAKPIEVSMDLNEWVRFDHPAVYRLRITSYRVSSLQNKGWEQTALESNEIELHIIPATPEWQSATLKAILPNLYPEKPEYQGAAADLRYLATAAGIGEMTNRMRAGDAYDITNECSMGLIGLPDSLRDMAIASMNERIAEPDYPISNSFFRTMSLLHVITGSSKESIREQRQSYAPAFWQTLFSAVSKKEGAARAQTVQTLLVIGSNMNMPDLNSRMNSLLASSLLELDNRSQIDDLRQHWEMLRSPSILPDLQALAMLSALNDSNLGPYSREDLKSVAFKRWYELDPAGARSEILAEIGSTVPALSAQAIRFMPAEPLPQFEQIWAQAYLESTRQQQESVLGSLLVRFGTGAAVPQMIAKLDGSPRDVPCMSRALALAYLVRFSPEDARPVLKREMVNGDAACGGTLLLWISDHATAPLLNEVADEALNDTDPQTFGDAIRYLTSYGTKADQKFVWERYAKWAETWTGKAEVLDHQEPGFHDENSGLREGKLLGLALISNQGWIADQALITRVLGMCVGQQMCKTLRDAVAAGEPLNRVVVPNAAAPLGIVSNESFAVAQYNPRSREQLEAKLSQYPTGTKFTLFRVWTATEDQQKLEDEVRAIFKKYGMILETQTN
jgi:hypothetical protein